MKVRVKAPEGYKYHDSVTGKDYSEVVIDEKAKDRFTLVADESDPVTDVE